MQFTNTHKTITTFKPTLIICLPSVYYLYIYYGYNKEIHNKLSLKGNIMKILQKLFLVTISILLIAAITSISNGITPFFIVGNIMVLIVAYNMSNSIDKQTI